MVLMVILGFAVLLNRSKLNPTEFYIAPDGFIYILL